MVKKPLLVQQPRPYTWSEIVRTDGIPDFRNHQVAKATEIVKIGAKDAMLQMRFKSGFETFYTVVKYQKKVFGLYGTAYTPTTAYDLRNMITRTVEGVVVMKIGQHGKNIPTKMYVDLGLIKEGQPSGVFVLAKGQPRADLITCYLDYQAELTTDKRCERISLENFESYLGRPKVKTLR